VCAQLNEFPFIRYEKASALSSSLARLVSDQLGRIYRSSAAASVRGDCAACVRPG
jgi:hypothetical protein